MATGRFGRARRGSEVRTRAGTRPPEGEGLAHDLPELEVLRRVDRSDAGGREPRPVLLRDDAAGDDRRVNAFRAEQADDLGDDLEVPVREDGEADHVDVRVTGDRGDLLRREPVNP